MSVTSLCFMLPRMEFGLGFGLELGLWAPGYSGFASGLHRVWEGWDRVKSWG